MNVSCVHGSFGHTMELGTCWSAGPSSIFPGLWKMVTAAHVVWRPREHKAASAIVFSPGGGEVICKSKQIIVFPAYEESFQGRVKVNPLDNDIAILYGIFPGGSKFVIQGGDSSILHGQSLQVSGFSRWPGVAGSVMGPAIKSSKGQRLVAYRAATLPGYSGGPVVVNGTNNVVGVHVWGDRGNAAALAIDAQVSSFITNS